MMEYFYNYIQWNAETRDLYRKHAKEMQENCRIQIDDMLRTNKNMEVDIQKYRKENVSLRNELEKYKREILSLRWRNDNESLMRYQKTYESYKQEIELLKNENDSLRRYKRENQKLKQKIAELENCGQRQ